MEYRALRSRELLLAGRLKTLVQASAPVLALGFTGNARDFLGSTGDTADAIGPAGVLQIVQAIVVGLESFLYVYQVHGAAPSNSPNYVLWVFLCQGNNHPVKIIMSFNKYTC